MNFVVFAEAVSPQAVPAPFWFVQLFKVIGFVLHTVPMGLWFAGLPIVIGCALWNCHYSEMFARRMFGQFPILLALGINFGIVPLLFLQAAYYKPFYTATILMAWHWLGIIPILIVGYYSMYLAAFSRSTESDGKRNGKAILFGIIAALCLSAIGILIVNGLSLMVRSDLWPGLMEKTNYFGATTGIGNNMRDPAVWFRLATMFGLGLLTTAVWSLVDSHFLVSKQVDEPTRTEYRRWTFRLAALLAVLGAILLTGIEAAIKEGTGGAALKTAYPLFGYVLLGAYAVALSLCVGWLAKEIRPIIVFVAVLLQLSTLAGFGVLRQIGQNAGVMPTVDVANLPTAVQWTPLLAFLLVFVLGLAVIAWMLRALIQCKPNPTEQNQPN